MLRIPDVDLKTKMAESVEGFEQMDYADDAIGDESLISVSIKTPQDIRKVSVCRTGSVKQVWYVRFAHWGRVDSVIQSLTSQNVPKPKRPKSKRPQAKTSPNQNIP